MKKIIAILLIGPCALAQSTPNAEGNKAYTGASPSINQSAAQAQDQNKKGAQQAQIIGTGLTMTGGAIVASCCSSGCYGQCAVGVAMIVMGVMAQMQSSAHSSAANGAGVTMDATNGYGYTDGAAVTTSNNGHISDPGTASSFASKAKSAIAGLGGKASGLSFNDQTGKITLPNGQGIGAGDVSSTSAMASAGLSKDGIASVMSELSKAEKLAADKTKSNVPSFGSDDVAGGGGGGGGSSNSANAYGQQNLAGQRGLSSINSKDNTAGLSKNYNGEPIGVANDSIFNMMTRRYNLKEKQDSFFNPALILQK